MQIIQAGSDQVSKRLRLLVATQDRDGIVDFYTKAPNVVVASAGASGTALAAAGAKFANIGGEDDLYALSVALRGSAEEREAKLGFKVDTLVIDSIDELQRLMLVRRLEKTGKTETDFEDWTWIANRFDRIYTGLNALDINIITISNLANIHESSVFKLGIQGAFANQIHKFVDYAYVLELSGYDASVKNVSASIEDEIKLDYDVNPTRVLRLTPTPKYPWIHGASISKTGFSLDLTDEDINYLFEVHDHFVVKPSKTLYDSEAVASNEKTEEVSSEPVEEILPEGMKTQADIKAKLLKK